MPMSKKLKGKSSRQRKRVRRLMSGKGGLMPKKRKGKRRH